MSSRDRAVRVALIFVLCLLVIFWILFMVQVGT